MPMNQRIKINSDENHIQHLSSPNIVFLPDTIDKLRGLEPTLRAPLLVPS